MLVVRCMDVRFADRLQQRLAIVGELENRMEQYDESKVLAGRGTYCLQNVANLAQMPGSVIKSIASDLLHPRLGGMSGDPAQVTRLVSRWRKNST